jgi:hypothetical protein
VRRRQSKRICAADECSKKKDISPHGVKLASAARLYYFKTYRSPRARPHSPLYSRRAPYSHTKGKEFFYPKEKDLFLSSKG